MAYCANHPETAAAAYCRTCGKPLCEHCKRDVRGVIYCEECIAARLGGSMPAGDAAIPPPPPTVGSSRTGSNPTAAMILGLIPGVGAMYNGQLAKGLLHIAIFVMIIVMTSEASGFFGLFIPAWIFYMAFDAYHTAKARQLGLPAPDFLGLNKMFGVRDEGLRYSIAGVPGGPQTYGSQTPEPTGDRNALPVGAYWLIGLGVFFLLANLNIFDWRLGRYLWEFVVIGFGLYLGYQRWTGPKRGRRFCPCMRCRTQGMTGPVMMITVGVLGLLAATYVLRWHNSWPLFLIVFGAVRLAQMSASTEGHVDIVPPVPPPSSSPAGTTATTASTTTSEGDA